MNTQLSKRLTRGGAVIAITAALALGMSSLVSPTASSAPIVQTTSQSKPKRVVFIVLDQLRPEFIDAFDMQNVKALIRGGTSFPNAYLGHMASETVVSHNVMTSGQLPKNMGWSDEWFRDSDGVLGPVDGKYVSGSMSQPQFDALIDDKGYPKLTDYLNTAFPGKKVATIGEKNYAVYSMSGPGSGNDIRMTFSGRSYDCDGDTTVDNTWRGPTGPNVPTYISAPVCNKYYVDAEKGDATNTAPHYGTLTTSPAWMYPLEGNRDFPGFDSAHPGGDEWVTNAAFDVMDNEDWSGLLLTYGGLDKAGHMWGGLNDVPPYPAGADPAVHIANMARIADEQVGRVIEKLKDEGLMDETLVVLTTDHAQNTAENFYGINGPGRGNFNWYFGTATNGEAYMSPQPEIQRLIDETGQNVEMSMQDSAIRTWLVDRSDTAKRQAADVMATMGAVRATYYRVGDRYQLRWQAPKSAWGKKAWAWHMKRSQEIVNTEAAEYGPDVIGLLANDSSYGVKGDHGGAQESVQRIPIVFYGAGIKAGARPTGAIRSVDILPTLLRELRIPATFPMDGRSYPLP